MRANVQVCDFSAIIIMVLDTCVSLVMPVMMALNDFLKDSLKMIYHTVQVH